MIFSDRNLYFHNVHDIPPKIRDSVKLATVEFAGVNLIPPTSKYLANPGLSNHTFVDGRHILL
jgi:hypothetical protein